MYNFSIKIYKHFLDFSSLTLYNKLSLFQNRVATLHSERSFSMHNEENRDIESGSPILKAFTDSPVHITNMPPREGIPPIDVLFKQERAKKGISQKELAKDGDVTNIQISRIERGECNPSVRTLVHLSPYLGYPLEDLLIASHYQGALPTADPTYVDLDGRVIDLKEAAQFMYHIDGELLLLVINLYMNYTIPDGKLLKILLKCIAECRSTESKDESTSAPDEEEKNKKPKPNHLFTDAFSNLKQFIFSFDRLAHGTAN